MEFCQKQLWKKNIKQYGNMVHSTSMIIGIKSINMKMGLILKKDLECSHDKDRVKS